MTFVRLSSALVIAASFAAQTVAQSPAPQKGPLSRVTNFEIISRRPAFGGKGFGAAGPYEILIGQARAVLDPRHPLNQVIADIDKAPRNAAGLVEYSFDVQILKPVDLTKGNGVLTYEVNNRGGRLVYSYFNEAGTAFEEANIGNGFLMNHGHTVVWTGWQGDLRPTAANPPILAARLPVATENGQPILGKVREEFIRDTTKAPVRRLTYPAATQDQSQATLTVRVNEGDARRPVPASEWSFVDSTTIDIKEAPGTDAGAIYELTYTAKEPIVLGMGYAGIRDFVSFLRHSATDEAGGANPLFVNGKPVLRTAVATGTSQSGRVQRDFIYLGFNQDTAGRKVFDGINPIVGGGRRTFVNFRFGQPGRYTRQHEDHMYPMSEFPFTYATTTDPLTGKTDGLFARCSTSKSCPKVIQLDADSEAYQGQASLILTDTKGQDVKLPDDVRYWYLNTAHAQGEIGCRDAPNTVSPWPYYRAAFDALVRWTRDGTAPPPTSAPSVAKGTFITPAAQAAQHPKIPGKPYVVKMSELGVRDFSVFPPTESAKKYPLLVQKLDQDGNPTAGIIVPEIAAPLATISGRSVRRQGFAEGELCSTAGSTIPFAKTKDERQASGDPRLSLEERYPNGLGERNAAYERAITKLVADRYLLSEDGSKLIGAVTRQTSQ